MKNKKIFSINKIVIIICIIIFVLYNIIFNITKDNISTMLLLGADYKTFTLGLGEFFRLITAGFCHFNFIHLLGNMVSLFSLGSFIEYVYGKKRYLLYLFGGILFGSLTCGILNLNIIESGISSALYTFFVIVILHFIFYRRVIPYNFIMIIFLNIGLNFLPYVAWQSHLGGAVAGFIFFFIDYYGQTKNITYKYALEILLIFSLLFMSYKYYSTKNSILDYPGTDQIYLNYTKKYVPFINQHYENKIYNYYEQKGY